MEKDKRPTEAFWGERLTEGELESGIWKSMQIRALPSGELVIIIYQPTTGQKVIIFLELLLR